MLKWIGGYAIKPNQTKPNQTKPTLVGYLTPKSSLENGIRTVIGFHVFLSQN